MQVLKFSLLQLSVLISVGILVIALAFFLSRRPGADRDWSPALSQVAKFEKNRTSGYSLKNVRAFEYGLEGALRKEWIDREIDPHDLVEVWYFIEPFAGSPLFAHSYLSFVFEDENDSRTSLAISIEARKEADNPYSPVRGLFRAYELLYVWSTEKDVHTRIAIKLDHGLEAYQLTLPQEQAIEIFEHFVKRTNDLSAKPRFYNTFHSNCTNELAKAVNDAFPGALPWHRSWVMTGRSAKWLHRLGFLGEPGRDFTNLHATADIQPLVKKSATLPDAAFSIAWRNAHHETNALRH